MANNQVYPVVIVPGIGQSKVVEYNAAGEPVRTVWPLQFDKDKLLDRMKGPFMKMMLFRRDLGFTDALLGVLRETVAGITADAEGNMKPNVRAVTYEKPFSECTADEKRFIYKMAPVQELAKEIGEDKIFFFSYNSFDKPYTVAAQLKDYIEMAKRRTGADKVGLLPLSLGGAMVTAYLDAYGASDVYRIVYIVPALQGTRLIGDIMSRDLALDSPAELVGALVGDGAADALSKVMGMMPAGMPDKLTKTLLDTGLNEVIYRSGAMWACLPPDRYDTLAPQALSDKKYASFRAEADRYHAAQTKLKETLQRLHAEGVNVYILACYGRALPEICAGAKNVSSDGIIDIHSASLGAKAAPLNETLPPDAQSETPRLSPDGSLDASFGAFPDSTWYFYDQYHDSIAYNDTALLIAQKALTDDSFTGVGSDPALGQFQNRQDNRENRG